ncbi:MAG: ROK family protein [Actinobacteria bacterium]|nr:ROK family protein [Actinomycetota bacterium]
MTLTIGIDIGGTKIAAGVVDESGKILKYEKTVSPSRDRTAIRNTIFELCKPLLQSFDVSAIGISAAGFLSKDRKQILFSPNLDMTGFHIGEEIASLTSKPVVLENDANSAAWGEFQFGAGREFKNLVMLTIGTGLGSGIVIENRLVVGGYGMAAEAGHSVLVPDGEDCGCGLKGCFEQYASGSALTRNARKLAIANPDAGRALIEYCGGNVELITGERVTELAQRGDEIAIALLTEIGTRLGQGLAGIAAVLDPEIFVIGGGGSGAGELILQPARRSFLKHLTAAKYRPIAPILQAQLGNAAGIVGVADLARL